MDYGDRQTRAEGLVKMFRAQPRATFPWRDRSYTGAEIADEIEGMTEFGRTLVAVAGFVIEAINRTPEFFRREAVPARA